MQWRIDRTVREKALKFKADYEKLFEDMRVPMRQLSGEVTQYLKRENLWNDLEAVHEMRCCLPLCLLQDNLNRRYYELFMKENGEDEK